MEAGAQNVAGAQSEAGAVERRLNSREVVFLLCILSLIALSLFTAFVTRMYHKKVHTLADDYFSYGEERFQAGDTAAALTDYQNALVYSPNNTKFQFHLAEALAAAGRYDQARPYLLALLSEAPGSGEVNLQLARIAAHNGAMSDALRYYQGAIYGEWPDDSVAMRWHIRHALCEYLIAKKAIGQATPAVIDLAENTPDGDVGKQKIVGQLLLVTGQWNRAQILYRALLTADRFDEEALAGAGRAAFELGEYKDALEDFNRLSPERRNQPDIARYDEMAHRVFVVNPFLGGLSQQVKAQRAANALALAETRAQSCAKQAGVSLAETPPRSELQIAYATNEKMSPDWSARDLQRFPDRLDAAMQTTFDIENAAAKTCGEPTGDDRALWLLGHSRMMVNR
ncbi:MAG TPA: tetratricopeptide repeat protein [Candidatus Acidoferrales bacterium]